MPATVPLGDYLGLTARPHLIAHQRPSPLPMPVIGLPAVRGLRTLGKSAADAMLTQ
jgi:hypothetical protein